MRRTLIGFSPAVLMNSADPDGGGGGGDVTLASLLSSNANLQTEIEQMIERRIQRDRKSRQNDNGGPSAEERAELERLRQEAKDRERSEAERKGEFEKVKQSLREEFEAEKSKWSKDREGLVGELRTERGYNQLVAAASKHSAIDPHDVAELLSRRVRLDNAFKPQVLDEQGEPWIKGGEPVSIDFLVESFLSKKPHLVKATGQEGTAGEGGRSTSDRGNQDGLDTEVADAKAAWEEAEKAAKASPSTAAAVKVQKLKHAYDAAVAKKKAK